MAAEDKIEKVDALDKKARLSKIDEHLEALNKPVEGKFETALDQQNIHAKTGVVASHETGLAKTTTGGVDTSLHSLHVQSSSSIPSVEQIQNRSKEAIQKIDKVKETLETAQVEIKRPVRKLMQDKLNHIDDSIRVALSKSGTEVTEPTAATQTGDNSFSPIRNFIDHLTHAQYQLENLGTYLESMAADKRELAPANMLAIQIKVTHIQQEVEFFSNLLNKSLESTKALMNVQV